MTLCAWSVFKTDWQLSQQVSTAGLSSQAWQMHTAEQSNWMRLSKNIQNHFLPMSVGTCCNTLLWQCIASRCPRYYYYRSMFFCVGPKEALTCPKKRVKTVAVQDEDAARSFRKWGLLGWPCVLLRFGGQTVLQKIEQILVGAFISFSVLYIYIYFLFSHIEIYYISFNFGERESQLTNIFGKASNHHCKLISKRKDQQVSLCLLIHVASH